MEIRTRYMNHGAELLKRLGMIDLLYYWVWFKKPLAPVEEGHGVLGVMAEVDYEKRLLSAFQIVNYSMKC
jgi:hypothetical protein